MYRQSSDSSILLCLFLSNNHLQNVKTLQSIYRQTYGAITLCLINNGLMDFQCERYIYNLNVKRPDTVKQVYLHENIDRVDTITVIDEILNKFNTDYLYILMAGECLKTGSSLREAITFIDLNKGNKMFVFPMEIGKKHIAANTYPDLNNSVNWTLYRDCMFIYNRDLMGQLNDRNSRGYVSYARSLMPFLTSQEIDIAFSDKSLCVIDDNYRGFENK